jgi:ABC-type transporter Mla maintaining outer membrane lipid asymmetry ATPase subunit MlaF
MAIVLGASGAGKSVILKLIPACWQPDSGRNPAADFEVNRQWAF